MQTRSLAAASGALVVLGFSLLALRAAAARPAATPEPSGGIVSAPAPTDDFRHWGCAASTAPAPGTTKSVAAAPAPAPEIQAEIALTISDTPQRAATLADALAAWATIDAGAALVWLERHPEQDKALLTQAIGEGLASDPAATTFALTYLAQDREFGALLAGALVRALAAHGDATGAVRLAHAAPEGWAHEWATIAFANLAYADAATALEAIAAVRDPALRRTTAAAIIAGWAECDPAGLAQHADVFIVPAERSAALAAAQRGIGNSSGSSQRYAGIAPRS